MSGCSGDCGVRMLPIYSNLEDWLRDERRRRVKDMLWRRGWTMGRLAKQVGVSRQWVSQIVNGSQRPKKATTLAKVERALRIGPVGYPVCELLKSSKAEGLKGKKE